MTSLESICHAPLSAPAYRYLVALALPPLPHPVGILWASSKRLTSAGSLITGTIAGVRDQRRRPAEPKVPRFRRPLLPGIQHHQETRQPLAQPFRAGQYIYSVTLQGVPSARGPGLGWAVFDLGVPPPCPAA